MREDSNGRSKAVDELTNLYHSEFTVEPNKDLKKIVLDESREEDLKKIMDRFLTIFL